MNEWGDGSVGGAGKRGVVKACHAAEPTAGALRPGREERWRLEEPGARAQRRRGSGASLGSRERCLCGSPQRDRGPDPRPCLPHPGGSGQPALRSRGGPRTRAGSPDALPAAPRSASPTSLQPNNTARSADSRGAGPPAAAGQ